MSFVQDTVEMLSLHPFLEEKGIIHDFAAASLQIRPVVELLEKIYEKPK